MANQGIDLGGGVIHDRQDHCSERDGTASFDDCVPCSLVMLARAAGKNIESSVEEAKKLRKAANFGADGGTTIEGHRAAFAKRYGDGYTRTTAPHIGPVLTPGLSAAVVGSLKNFPDGHPLFTPQKFKGLHCTFVACLPDGRFLWDDPLVPEGTKYAGQIVSADDLQAYYTAGGGLREIGFLSTGISEVQMLRVTDTVAVTLDVAKHVQLFRLNGSALIKAAKAQIGRLSPFATDGFRAAYITTGGKLQLVLVRATDVTNMKPVAAPAVTPAACQALVDAATASLHAKITVLEGKLQALGAPA